MTIAPLSPPTPDDVTIVRRYYDALNRGDVDAAIADFDPAIVRIEFAGTPTGGTWHGLAALRANVEAGRGTWAEGRCRPEAYVVTRDRLVVPVHVRVRLRNATEWLEGWIADGFVLREGRIVEYRSFMTRADAMAWAGLDADILSADAPMPPGLNASRAS